jgi:hypothetical protein
MAQRQRRRAAERECRGGGGAEEGKENTAAGPLGFIAQPRMQRGDTHELPRHVEQLQAATDVLGSGWKVAGDGGRWRHAVGDDFEKFTEIPLAKIYKLLSNFLKKLKICENKSCSIFKVLQLSQYKNFPIQPRF